MFYMTTNDIPSYSNINYDDINIPNNNGLKSDLDKVYNTNVKKHNDLEIYTIDALNSIKDYRYFLKYPISREDIPKYIQLIYRNNYYIDKYVNQRKILYVIDIYCVIIILLTLIKNNFSYFDEISYSTIVGFLLATLFIYICYKLWDIFLRSEYIYDEYDFNKLNEPKPTSDNYDLNIPLTVDECSK